MIEELCQRNHGGMGAFTLLRGKSAEGDTCCRVDSSGAGRKVPNDFCACLESAAWREAERWGRKHPLFSRDPRDCVARLTLRPVTHAAIRG